MYHNFKYTTPGVLQGVLVIPILFNTFRNNFFPYIRRVFVHNYEEGNTLSSFAKIFVELIRILTSNNNNNNTVKWFSEKKTIANPEKFKYIFFKKNQVYIHPTHFLIENSKIDIESVRNLCSC